MSFQLVGDVIEIKDQVAIVPDSSIRKVPKKKKGAYYEEVSHSEAKKIIERLKKKGVIKNNTGKRGVGKRTRSNGNKTKKNGKIPSPVEKKKKTPYQIFNEAVRERKEKYPSFKLSMQERFKIWNRISNLLDKQKIKPTKKDIREFVFSLS